jgi:hypothetical protein
MIGKMRQDLSKLSDLPDSIVHAADNHRSATEQSSNESQSGVPLRKAPVKYIIRSEVRFAAYF